MYEKMIGLYKSSLGVLGWLVLIVFAIGAGVIAAYVGFGSSFSQCYGTPCSDTANNAMFIFPGIVLFVFIFIGVKWHGHRQTIARRGLQSKSVDKELMGASAPEQQIITLLRANDSLKLTELSSLAKMPEDKLLVILGNLLRKQLISQSAQNGLTTFSIKPKQSNK